MTGLSEPQARHYKHKRASRKIPAGAPFLFENEISRVSSRACHARQRGEIGFNPLQLHMTHRVLPTKSPLRVEDFKPGQPAVLVIISSDALGQIFRRDRGFAERDAQRIHFGVIADFHGSKVVGIDRYHNYFFRLVHKNGANLLGRINFPVPIPSKWKIFPAIQSSKFGCAPCTGADGIFHLRHCEAA